MVKVIAVSVVALLLVGSTSFAQLGTLTGSENWNHSLGSTVNLSGAEGIGGTLLVLGTAAGQHSETTLGTELVQGIGVLGVQGAFADNDTAAVICIGQGLTVQGLNAAGTPGVVSGATGPGQVQAVAADVGASLGGAEQFEGIGIAAAQDISKGGNGTAIGVNGAAVILGQEAENTSTETQQGILIIGGQLSGIEGIAGSNGSVKTEMKSMVLQYQGANLTAP